MSLNLKNIKSEAYNLDYSNRFKNNEINYILCRLEKHKDDLIILFNNLFKNFKVEKVEYGNALCVNFGLNLRIEMLIMQFENDENGFLVPVNKVNVMFTKFKNDKVVSKIKLYDNTDYLKSNQRNFKYFHNGIIHHVKFSKLDQVIQTVIDA